MPRPQAESQSPSATDHGSSQSLKTRVRRRNLAELVCLERNARFLPGDQFRQLVQNLKKDGVLTSTPLIYCPDSRPEWSVDWPDGTVLSGNHRVEGAIAADIPEADCIEVVSPITKERAIAIQLSHNSIVGHDDPNVLAELYADLKIDWKQYSGLDDEILKGIKDIDVASLSVKTPNYEEISIMFLPEQLETFRDALAQLKKYDARGLVTLLGSHADFDRFFDTVIAVKKFMNVNNSAVALNVMARLALERCAQLESEKAELAGVPEPPPETRGQAKAKARAEAKANVKAKAKARAEAAAAAEQGVTL